MSTTTASTTANPTGTRLKQHHLSPVAPSAITPSNSIKITTADVRKISTQFVHAVHAYHGVDAFSRDGDRILYAGINEPGRAAIVIQNLLDPDGHDIVLAQNVSCDFHTAARQRWLFDDTTVLFQTDHPEGLRCPAIVSIDQPGKSELIESLVGYFVRAICADGIHAGACRNDLPDPHVARVNLRTGDKQILFTAQQCAELLPKDIQRSDSGYRFTHPVFNHDQTRMFAKLMYDPAPQNARPFCAFFVYHEDSDRLMCLGHRISGHPFWMLDDCHILNVKSPQDGSDNRWLVRVNTDTGEDEKLCDLPIEGPGHPSQSPDGRWLATDAFTPDGLHSPIYVFDAALGCAREIARLNHHFKPGPQDHFCRGQPHPVWSPDSQKLLINCNEGGTKYQLLLLENFLMAGES